MHKKQPTSSAKAGHTSLTDDIICEFEISDNEIKTGNGLQKKEKGNVWELLKMQKKGYKRTREKEHVLSLFFKGRYSNFSVIGR